VTPGGATPPIQHSQPNSGSAPVHFEEGSTLNHGKGGKVPEEGRAARATRRRRLVKGEEVGGRCASRRQLRVMVICFAGGNFIIQ
jgi:hypothetical protein